MTEPVTIHDGYYIIQASSWLAQRTGAAQSELSDTLHEFTRCDVFSEYWPQMDTAARMQLFAAARGWPLGDASRIWHDDTVLNYGIDIVLTGDGGQALALVSIAGHTPEIYVDATTDPGYWLDATTIELTCPQEHRWSWDGGREPQWFFDRDQGPVPVPTTLRDMFGGLPHAPYQRCRGCAAFNDGQPGEPCPASCTGTAIYCPLCQARCYASLPQIPTFTQEDK
jgi:hypothetical protein